jgi:hypothetical protein
MWLARNTPMPLNVGPNAAVLEFLFSDKAFENERDNGARAAMVQLKEAGGLKAVVEHVATSAVASAAVAAPSAA